MSKFIKREVASLFFILLLVVAAFLVSTVAATTTTTASVLSGELNFNFTWTDDNFDLSMDSPISSGRYFSISVATSGSGMGGLGVACKQPDAGTTTTTCTPITTAPSSATGRTDGGATILAASTDGTRAYVTVRLTASLMGVSASGAQRTLYAVGNWNAGSSPQLPTQHLPSERGEISLAYTQVTTTSTTVGPLDNTTTTTTAPPPDNSTTEPPPSTTTTSVTNSSTQSEETTTTEAATTTTTGAVAETTTPTPTPTPTQSSFNASTGALTVLNGDLVIRYSWIGDTIWWTLDIPISMSNYYAAIAMSSGGMEGVGVACRLPTPAGDGDANATAATAKCKAISTTPSFNVQPRTDPVVAVVEAWTDSLRAHVTVAASSLHMGITDTFPVRAIFAIGPYDDANDKLQYHHSRGYTTMNFTRSTSTTTTTTTMAQPTNATSLSSSSQNISGSNDTSATTGEATSTLPSTTAETPATTTTTTTTQLPGWYSELDGNFLFTWQLSDPTPDASGNAQGNITITMKSLVADKYGAISWATSSTGMAGAGFACVVSSSGSGASCRDITTTASYGVQARNPQQIHILYYAISPSGGSVAWEMSVTMPVAPLSIKTGNRRLLFATGDWDYTTTLPKAHTKRTAGMFDFFSSSTNNNTNNNNNSSSNLTSASTTTATGAFVMPEYTGPMLVGQTFSVLDNDQLSVNFTIPPADSTDGGAAQGNLTMRIVSKNTGSSSSSTRLYKAIVWASSQSGGSMEGFGFACIVLPSSGVPTCRDITTYNWGVSPQLETLTHIISSSLLNNNNNEWEMTITTPAKRMGIKAGANRMLFAEGQWDEAANMPKYHSEKEDEVVDMFQGTLVYPPNSTKREFTGALTLGGGLAATWEQLATPDDNGFAVGELTVTLKSTEPNYKAIVWGTGTLRSMAGYGIACVHLPATSQSVCRDIRTTASLQCHADEDPAVGSATKIKSVEVNVDGFAWVMTVTTPVDRLFIREGPVVTLVAQGTWNTASNMPNPHDASSPSARSAANQDWFRGGAAVAGADHAEMNRFKMWLGLTFCWFVLLSVIGAMFRAKHESSSPGFTTALQVLATLTVFGSAFIVTAAAYYDFEEFGAVDSVHRAIGAGCCYFFAILLLPVQKMQHGLNLGWLAGSSFERFVKFHWIIGICLLVMVIVHCVFMITQRVSPELPFDKAILIATGHHPPLYAFIGLICFIVMFITAILRRKASYRLFRIVHAVTFPAIIAMFALHYPLLLAAVVPGGVAYFIDLVYKWGTTCQANAQVVSVSHDAGSGVTRLRVQVDDVDYDVGPGQFSLVTVSRASGFIAHPFTVAAFNANTGVLTFYIKNFGGPFTKRVAELAEAGDIGSVSVSRPIGQLGVRLDVNPIIFLVGGGVGVTPVLSIASHIGRMIRDGNLTRLHTIHIVWSVREASLIEYILPELQKCISDIELRGVVDQARGTAGDVLAQLVSDVAELRGHQVTVNAAIYQTSGRSAKDPQTRRHVPNPDEGLEVNLLDIANEENNNDNNDAKGAHQESLGREYDRAARLVPRNRISRVSGRPNFEQLFGSARAEGVAVSVYACGPAPFMAEIEKHALENDCLYHAETFEL